MLAFRDATINNERQLREEMEKLEISSSLYDQYKQLMHHQSTNKVHTPNNDEMQKGGVTFKNWPLARDDNKSQIYLQSPPMFMDQNQEQQRDHQSQQMSLKQKQINKDQERKVSKTRLLLISKLIDFLKDKFIEYNLSQQKKVVQNSTKFNIIELFEEVDADDKGFITVNDLKYFFAAERDMTDCNYTAIISYWNGR